MENAVEALKIAFAVLMFGIALTISISSFSQATQAVNAITTLRDREEQYTYVIPSEGLTRNVGIESVVTTMYRAYKENMKIYFYDSHGNPLNIYLIPDGNGNFLPTSCFDFSNENFASQEQAVEFLNVLIGGDTDSNYDKYSNRLLDTNGIYKQFANREFQEQLGEYYEGTGASEIKKRVITYTLQ